MKTEKDHDHDTARTILTELFSGENPTIYTVWMPTRSSMLKSYYRVFAIKDGRLVDIALYIARICSWRFVSLGDYCGCVSGQFCGPQDLVEGLNRELFAGKNVIRYERA